MQGFEQGTTKTKRKGGNEMVHAVEQEQVVGFRARKWSLREWTKSEKGLTLIELLAVIVILAIIAAIAIPSIGGIIAKTKKESHRANAQMIVDGARFKITTEDFKPDAAGGSVQSIKLDDILKAGYLEKAPKDPEGSGDYDVTKTVVKVTKGATGSYTYEIDLETTAGAVFNPASIPDTDIKTATFK
jgi:type IV pilus assembly protein PilA